VHTAALIGLAGAHRDRGHSAKATTYARQALATAHDAGYSVLEGNAHTTLATVLLAAGDHSAATEHATQALQIHQQTGHQLGQARALATLGHAQRHAGNLAAAHANWRQALDIVTGCGADATELRDLLAPPVDRRADSPA
jgi:tetratricopeptide (TPR) repeat protein